MVKRRAASRPSTDEWQAEHIRLTAFPHEPVGIQDLGTWKDVVGTEPATREERPNERAVLEAGEFGIGWLSLQVTPSRIDWRYTIKTEEPPPSGFPVISSFAEAIKAFGPPMKRWLRTCPSLDRIAFGTLLLREVGDPKEGYTQIGQLLPSVKIDPVGTHDFSYRINRRRVSRVGPNDLEINRISTWSLARLSTVHVRVGSGQPQIVESEGLLFACRLDLDINTTQEYERSLRKSRLSRLFQELVDLGTEIAENGDRA